MAILEQHDITPTIRVMKVSNTKVYQIRFKDSVTNRWLTRSSKTTNLLEAATIAKEIATEVSTVTFKNVYQLWVSSVDDRLRKNSAYIGNLENYALPVLGDLDITKIGQKTIQQLLQYREQTFFDRYKKLPSKSTVLNWNASIGHVFDYAVIHEFVHHTQLPKLNVIKQGTNAKRRLHFTDTQLTKLSTSEFFKEVTTPKSTRLREMLFHYCQLLLGTGLRSGTETDGLLLSDLHEENAGTDDFYLTLNVRKGKTTLYTGNRQVVLRDNAAVATGMLEHFAKTSKAFDGRNTRLLGEVTTDRLQAVFKQLLAYENIDYKEGYSLYSFRHTYISKALLAGTSIIAIASQCGTSAEMIERNYNHITAKMRANELRF